MQAHALLLVLSLLSSLSLAGGSIHNRFPLPILSGTGLWIPIYWAPRSLKGQHLNPLYFACQCNQANSRDYPGVATVARPQPKQTSPSL